jgi:hypothetical protein
MPYLSKSIIDQIWLKATAVDGFNSDKWRKDFAGAWIQRDQFGLSGLQAPFGWAILHDNWAGSRIAILKKVG